MNKREWLQVIVLGAILVGVAALGQTTWQRSLSPDPGLPMAGAIMATIGHLAYVMWSNELSVAVKNTRDQTTDGGLPPRSRGLCALMRGAGFVAFLAGLWMMFLWFFGPHF
jgi:hypothetical protein